MERRLLKQCDCVCVSFRQSVLERALSEKDSAIARLEVDGAKSQVEIEHLEQCRLSRNKLNDQLKVEVSAYTVTLTIFGN